MKSSPESSLGETNTYIFIHFHDVLVSSTSSLGGHLGKIRKPSAAAALLDAFQKAGGDLDVAQWNAAINACAVNSSWPLALSLFQRATGVDIVSYGALINVFAKAQRWAEPLELLDSLLKRQMQANTIVFSSSIAAGAQSGRWQTAFGLLSQMSQLRVVANSLTFNVVISSCGKSEWTRALGCLAELAPTPRELRTYNAAHAALSGKWLQSLALFEVMTSNRRAWSKTFMEKTAKQEISWTFHIPLLFLLKNCYIVDFC